MSRYPIFTLLSILFLTFLINCTNHKRQHQESTYLNDPQAINQGEVLFNQYCASCHNFEENVIGPSLGGVTRQQSPEWLTAFIKNAPQMIDSGDVHAVELFHQFNQYMPAFTMLDDHNIESLLAYIHTHQENSAAKREKVSRADSLINPIPEKIPLSDLVLSVKKALTLPASAENPPLARINKLLAIKLKTGNRLFIHDLRGKLYEITNNKPQVYLDITTEEPAFIDKPGLATGLGSFAFHPDFETNGIFYTIHTEAAGSATADYAIPDSIPIALQWVLTEWKTSNPQALSFQGTHRELLRVDMHSGIHGFQELTFNPLAKPGEPDYGMLYLGIGDGGASLSGYAFLCHDKRKIWGTVIRIDPTGNNSPNKKYGIPGDNPFVKNNDGALGEIWAYGFRNPHRICWDVTGSKKMFITNIGQASLEEVNLGKPGADYGWPLREGTFTIDLNANIDMVYPLPPNDPPSFTYPVAQYDHDEGNAISGGFVYAGESVPLLKGKYLFGDIVQGRIFFTEEKEMQQGKQAQIQEMTLEMDEKKTDLKTLTGNNRIDLRFGMDGNGELYMFTKADGNLWAITGCKQENLL